MRFFWTLLVCFFITGFTSAQRNVRIGFLDIDKVLAAHSGFSESSQDLKPRLYHGVTKLTQGKKSWTSKKRLLKSKGLYSHKKLLKNAKTTLPLNKIN
jgi:Skp family chaperone for outer membrane proteins